MVQVYFYKRPLQSLSLGSLKFHMGTVLNDGPDWIVMQVQGEGTNGSAQEVEWKVCESKSAAFQHAAAQFKMYEAKDLYAWEAHLFQKVCTFFPAGSVSNNLLEIDAFQKDWVKKYPIYNILKASCRTFVFDFAAFVGIKLRHSGVINPLTFPSPAVPSDEPRFLPDGSETGSNIVGFAEDEDQIIGDEPAPDNDDFTPILFDQEA